MLREQTMLCNPRTPASVLHAGAVRCRSPAAHGLGDADVTVALNGQDSSAAALRSWLHLRPLDSAGAAERQWLSSGSGFLLRERRHVAK